MKELKVDSEFKDLIPPPTEQEYAQLRENILADGCRDALVVWGETVVDGHNRLRICTEHGVDFKTVNMEFDSREDAIIWICKNQMGRRNITPNQRDYLMGVRYRTEKQIDSFRGNQYVDGSGQNVQNQTRREKKDGTAGRIGKEYGVDGRTVRRNEDFAKSLDTITAEAPEIKPLILSGKANVPKSTIVEIAQQDAPERARSIKDIKEGRQPVIKREPRMDKPIQRKPDAEPNETTRYFSDLSRVDGMNTPDMEAQRMCSDIRNSINLLMYAMKDIAFSELSPEARQEVEASANKLDEVVQLIHSKLKGEKI